MHRLQCLPSSVAILSMVAAILMAAVTTFPSRTESAPRWDVVASPSSGSESLLRSVQVVSEREAWAVGTQQTASYENHSLILHYVDGEWSVVPSPNQDPSCQDGNVVYGGNRLNALAVVSPNDVWAVGVGCLDLESLILHWDGASWSLVPSPAPFPENILSDVASVSANDVWAVGHSEEGIGVGTLVEHWDGTRWSVVPSPKPGTGGVLGGLAVASASDIWSAGSYYDEQEGIWETLIVHWDGTEWSVVPSPSPGTYTNALGGIAVVSPNDVWAVGAYSSGNGVQTLAEHWDGHRWEVVPSPNVETGYGTTNNFGSIDARSANDIWVSGMFQNQHTDIHQHRTLLGHWDGTSWNLVSSPSPGKSSGLADIAFTPSGAAWAVGIYSEYPIDIYDGHYTMAQSLILGGSNPAGAVGVGPGAASLDPSLGWPSPNPTAGKASFSIQLPQRAEIALSVFDVRGREVRSILAGSFEAGQRYAVWDGFDAAGLRARPGLYYVRFIVDGRVVASRSVTLLGDSER